MSFQLLHHNDQPPLKGEAGKGTLREVQLGRCPAEFGIEVGWDLHPEKPSFFGGCSRCRFGHVRSCSRFYGGVNKKLCNFFKWIESGKKPCSTTDI